MEALFSPAVGVPVRGDIEQIQHRALTPVYQDKGQIAFPIVRRFTDYDAAETLERRALQLVIVEFRRDRPVDRERRRDGIEVTQRVASPSSASDLRYRSDSRTVKTGERRAAALLRAAAFSCRWFGSPTPPLQRIARVYPVRFLFDRQRNGRRWLPSCQRVLTLNGSRQNLRGSLRRIGLSGNTAQD